MPTYPFAIRRSGNLTAACSVGWRLEGTGSSPIDGTFFPGGVLPSGSASFAAGETSQPAAIDILAMARPATKRTGRIILTGPIDCKFEAGASQREVAIPADTTRPPPGPYDLLPENWAVHAAPGQAGRLTWLAGGGFEIAGAANADGNNIALWCKTPVPSQYRLNFIYEKNEDTTPADASGRFAQTWIGYLGSTGGRPADVSAWTSTHYNPAGYEPVSDAVYGDFGKGSRTSWDTETTDAGNRNQARLVAWDEATLERLTPVPDPPSFPMSGVGTAYTMLQAREGNKFAVSKTPGGEGVAWTDAKIGNLGQPDGRLGYRWARGRGGKIKPVPGKDFLEGVDPPPTGDWPHGPWKRAPAVPTSGSARQPVSDARELRAAIAAGASGQHILLPSGGNIALGGDLTIDCKASGVDAIYIRTDTESDDPSALCKLTGGNNILKDAQKTILHGFQMPDGKRIKWTGTTALCQVEQFTAAGCASDDPYGNPFIEWQSDCGNNLMTFFQYTGTASMCYMTEVDPTRFVLSHYHTLNCSGVGKMWASGLNPRDAAEDNQFFLQYFLDTGRSSNGDFVEQKCNGTTWRYGTMEFGASASDCQFKIRHGRLLPDGRPANDRSNFGQGPTRGDVLDGLLWVYRASTPRPYITVRGAYHILRNCWAVTGLGTTDQPTLDTALATNASCGLFVGARDGKTFPQEWKPDDGCGRRVGAYACKVGGLRGFEVEPIADSGWPTKGCSANPTYGGPYKPYSNQIAPATSTRPDRNSKMDQSASLWGSGNDYTTLVPGANHTKVPVRMLPGTVGPRAWRAGFNP